LGTLLPGCGVGSTTIFGTADSAAALNA